MHSDIASLLDMIHGALLAHVHMHATRDSFHVNLCMCARDVFYLSLAPTADVSLAALGTSCLASDFNLDQVNEWQIEELTNSGNSTAILGTRGMAPGSRELGEWHHPLCILYAYQM